MSNLTVEYLTRVNSSNNLDSLTWVKCESEQAEWEIWLEDNKFIKGIYLGNPEQPVTDFTKLPHYLKTNISYLENKVTNTLEEALSHTRLLIEKGAYEKDIEEPTPLEQKCVLVSEVREMLVDDLLSQGIHIESINLAWKISEVENGADEALNKGFLYSVLSYIEDLEEYFTKRSTNS